MTLPIVFNGRTGDQIEEDLNAVLAEHDSAISNLAQAVSEAPAGGLSAPQLYAQNMLGLA